MLANPTTIILGAGASAPVFPTGAELREALEVTLDCDDGMPFVPQRMALAVRLKQALVGSIDAFLTEPGNEDMVSGGAVAIAKILLPHEKLHSFPGWYRILFNAIRGPKDAEHTHPLRVVTFNYDVSLEFALYRAFYGLSLKDTDHARARLDESVEIIHVYGRLGDVAMPHGKRSYAQLPSDRDGRNSIITAAAEGIKLIGREPDSEQFKRAQEAIFRAEFLAVLGFGYDQTNIDNLRLTDHAHGKPIFSTGCGIGYGMRGWLRSLGLDLIMGPKTQHVGDFLGCVFKIGWHPDFMRWQG